MADSQIDTRVMLRTNSKILVTVDEALQDILVVSYAFESKLFQGVLLDSTKRYLPCRIPENAANQIGSPKNEANEEDKLFFSIRQRFTYFQEKPVHLNHFHLPKKLSKTKNQKMTVRLRPRQVLCSKCKSICNENSENVNSYPTRSKKPEPPDSSPRSLFSENRRDNQLPNNSPPKLCPTFVQRIPRLPNSDNNSINGNLTSPISRSEEFWFKPSDDSNINKLPCNVETLPDDENDRQMVLRKKRSVGSMEDLWDETVFEEGSKKAKTTPVIKISFGSQGEGTVLKIPSKVQLCSESETEDKQKVPSASKAAKKAMKKAKKEAKRKELTESPVSHKSPSPSELQYRKHRHKVKHKKKHKTEKPDEEIKERCLKQKLSINLRRLNSNTYEKTDLSSGESSLSSEDIPDFPVANSIDGYKDVTSCKTVNGNTFAVGDIVWGKIHGFPWWPGKVLNILIRQDSDEWDAHVSWYGSSTASLMPCDQLSPFLTNFKIRYNRRKKSAGYKEAIRLATNEASASNPEVICDTLLAVNEGPL
ncbi:unnamed protein product [Nezara viridula]|uniref:PWWP domain-containing protein n=2 Tax=Nezara viridula TaxID=85310 RepID=A0A9P0MQK2_NEZVI|nr:unnamed protein product [Nezara viridula]